MDALLSNVDPGCTCCDVVFFMKDWSRCLEVGMSYNKVTMLLTYSNLSNAESIYLCPYSNTYCRACVVNLPVQILAASYTREKLNT